MTDHPWSGLSGQHVVTWVGFGLLTPYSAVSMVLANPDLQSASVLPRLIAALVAQVVLFAMLVGWRWFVHRRPRCGATPLRVLTAFVAVTLIRAALLAVMLEAIGVTHDTDWPRRLFGAVVGFSAALAIIDVGLASISQHRARVALLRAQQRAAIRARETTIADMEGQRDAVVERIRADFMSRIDRLSDVDPATGLAALRSTASELLRPLALELARQTPPPPPTVEPSATSLDVRAFLSDATSGRPLDPTWTAILFLCFGGPFLLLAVPITRAVGLLVTGVLAIWLLLTLSNAAFHRCQRSMRLTARVMLLLALVLASTLLLALSSLIFVDSTTEPLRQVMIGDLLLVPTIALALVAARAAATQRQLTEDRMRADAFDLDWASSRARCMQWRQQRSLASALHGPVQSAVGVATIRLELAVQAGSADAELLDELREQLLAAIDRIDDRTAPASGLESTLAEFAGTWSGVCEIRWSIAPPAQRVLQNDAISHFAMRELATEGCWNAIRHAHAPRVDIHIEPERPRVLRLKVEDNGIPSDGTPAPGLGTTMLNDMTICWNRTRSGKLTTLEAFIPADIV